MGDEFRRGAADKAAYAASDCPHSMRNIVAGHMSRKIRNFRADKFDTGNKRKF